MTDNIHFETLNSIDDSITASPPAGAGVDLKTIMNEAKRLNKDEYVANSNIYRSVRRADMQYLNYERNRICEKCNKPGKEDGCCSVHCELFNEMYEAKESGFDIDPCSHKYCYKHNENICSGIENITTSYSDVTMIRIEAIKDKTPKIYELFKTIGIQQITMKQYKTALNTDFAYHKNGRVDYNLLNVARDKILDEDMTFDKEQTNKVNVEVTRTDRKVNITVGTKKAVYYNKDGVLKMDKEINRRKLIDVLLSNDICVEQVITA